MAAAPATPTTQLVTRRAAREGRARPWLQTLKSALRSARKAVRKCVSRRCPTDKVAEDTPFQMPDSSSPGTPSDGKRDEKPAPRSILELVAANFGKVPDFESVPEPAQGNAEVGHRVTLAMSHRRRGRIGPSDDWEPKDALNIKVGESFYVGCLSCTTFVWNGLSHKGPRSYEVVLEPISEVVEIATIVSEASEWSDDESSSDGSGSLEDDFEDKRRWAAAMDRSPARLGRYDSDESEDESPLKVCCMHCITKYTTIYVHSYTEIYLIVNSTHSLFMAQKSPHANLHDKTRAMQGAHTRLLALVSSFTRHYR